MMLPRFELEVPRSLADACAVLGAARGEAALMAGGTDLLVKMKHGSLKPRLVVSLARIEALARLQPTSGGGLRIGALATMSQLARSAMLQGAWAALAEGAASVAGPVIRNRATVGGNILTARPCADTAPPLVALGARLHLLGPEGSRSADLDGFITGPGTSGLAPEEILTDIELPPPGGGGAGSSYLKITRRAAMEVTIVGCAASVVLDEARAKVERARLVLTSVAPVPLRATAAEPHLAGHAPDERAIRAAAAAARDQCRPIDDHRAPAEYRRAMVEVLAVRALRIALERARGGRP